MKKHLVWFKFVVMAVLLAVLYRNVDFAKFRGALEGLQWGWLPLIYGLFLLNTTLSSWKWKMLLASDGVHVPLGTLLSSYLIATFFNLFMPSSIGGDAYRVVDTGKHGGSAKSFASVFADRLTGFLALAIWGLLFSAIGWSRLPDKRILWLPVIVSFVVCHSTKGASNARVARRDSDSAAARDLCANSRGMESSRG